MKQERQWWLKTAQHVRWGWLQRAKQFRGEVGVVTGEVGLVTVIKQVKQGAIKLKQMRQVIDE